MGLFPRNGWASSLGLGGSLRRNPHEHSVAVKVVQEETKDPLESADVRLGIYLARTDERGLASLKAAHGRANRFSFQLLELLQILQEMCGLSARVHRNIRSHARSGHYSNQSSGADTTSTAGRGLTAFLSTLSRTTYETFSSSPTTLPRASVLGGGNVSGLERLTCPDAWFHDLRRSAVRNLERAGVPQSTAMKLTGHLTASVYRRYAIADHEVLEEGVGKLAKLHGTPDKDVERRVLPPQLTRF